MRIINDAAKNLFVVLIKTLTDIQMSQCHTKRNLGFWQKLIVKVVAVEKLIGVDPGTGAKSMRDLINIHLQSRLFAQFVETGDIGGEKGLTFPIANVWLGSRECADAGVRADHKAAEAPLRPDRTILIKRALTAVGLED